jgi:tetratricopeptide (TPR) repeat protein
VAYEADDFDTAAERYERALTIKASYPEAWNDLGVVEFRREAYSKAREDFEKAVALDPNYTDAWLNLADVYDELGLAREQRDARAKAKALGARNEE